jgi:hypothetical protein
MNRNERNWWLKRKVAARKAILLALIIAGAFVLPIMDGKEKDTSSEEEISTNVVEETIGLETASFDNKAIELDDVRILLESLSNEEREEEPMRPEDVVAELVDLGYYRDDVPLEYELQDYLHLACQEAGVPYALALAVIQKETNFQNLIGDDGASEGYMQIRKKCHYDRMEPLGVTDLMDPAGNFRVGCDLLAELLGKYPTQEALTAYNSGSPGYNKYSYAVMGYYEEWKELVGDDVSGIKG